MKYPFRVNKHRINVSDVKTFETYMIGKGWNIEKPTKNVLLKLSKNNRFKRKFVFVRVDDHSSDQAILFDNESTEARQFILNYEGIEE